MHHVHLGILEGLLQLFVLSLQGFLALVGLCLSLLQSKHSSEDDKLAHGSEASAEP